MLCLFQEEFQPQCRQARVVGPCPPHGLCPLLPICLSSSSPRGPSLPWALAWKALQNSLSSLPPQPAKQTALAHPGKKFTGDRLSICELRDGIWDLLGVVWTLPGPSPHTQPPVRWVLRGPRSPKGETEVQGSWLPVPSSWGAPTGFHSLAPSSELGAGGQCSLAVGFTGQPPVVAGVPSAAALGEHWCPPRRWRGQGEGCTGLLHCHGCQRPSGARCDAGCPWELWHGGGPAVSPGEAKPAAAGPTRPGIVLLVVSGSRGCVGGGA
nr:uncharacterized protein LOC120366883 [Saimiri boliviensis boliviensis]